MDADEALARQLQEEERHFAQQQQLAGARLRGPPANSRQAVFEGRLRAGVATVLAYEDETLQTLALSVMPERVLELAQPSVEQEDELATRLLAWFKNDFFTWVNSPACKHCGSKETKAQGAAQPLSEEEVQGRAGMVEVYSCTGCGKMTRFPRYNNPAKLLETRSGRCGEWANCFTLCCRAAGLDARYVMDWTDHVWTEYFSRAQGRWVHMDACENERDKPLLYEGGWGKKLSYCIGFGRHGVADVSRRYTADWPAMDQRRTHVSDAWLLDACSKTTSSLRRGLPPEVVHALTQRDQAETLELLGGSPSVADAEHLQGRQTGSVEWRAARGELGNGHPPIHKPSTAVTAIASPAQQTTIQTFPTSVSVAQKSAAATASSNSSAVAAAATRPDASCSVPTVRELAENFAGTALNSETSAQAAPNSSEQKPASSTINRQERDRCTTSSDSIQPSASQSPPCTIAVSKEEFSQRVRLAFDAIMAAGGVTPNEAAVLALKRVRAQA